jgi:hypothetical protein
MNPIVFAMRRQATMFMPVVALIGAGIAVFFPNREIRY